MKKTLFTILTLLLSALFLITACDSPQGRVQEETTDPTETTAGNDITQAENADTEPTNATTTTAEPYETVDPDLIESIRTGEWADAKRLEQFYPNIFDIPVKHRPSDKDFEALYATSNDDYKTLDELIKIIGKPHSFHIKSSTTVFVWLTLEGNLRVAFGIGGLGAPSDISKEERLLYFTKFYVIQPKSDSDTRDPNTTITTPETTREKAPETTAEPYETVDPDLLYEIRSGAFADEAWLKRALPNIIDISVEYRISEKEFEPVYCDSSEDRKTLEELIKIVGKPHGFTNRTGFLWLVWITQEGTFVRAGIDLMTSNVPKGISLEERIFRYSLIYVQRLQAAPETTAEPYETVDPDLLYEIRNSPFADEAWLKQEFPNITDAEITYRAPEQKFESLFSASNDDYKTLDELIKIVGKPHGYTNRTGVVLFVWITAEGNPIPGYVYTMTSDLPEDVSFEERHLHYSKIYIQKPQSAPETTAEPYVETTTLAP